MPKSKEEKYIAYRKRKAFREGLLYYFFCLFPIQKNKIAVCTFEGKGGFCCNPRYIVEELHRRNNAYKFVWLVNDTAKQFPEYIMPVKNTLWNRAFHLTTSKVWIDNYRKPYGTKKRKGQYYLNTWHGASAFKTLGLWRGEAFSPIAYLVSKNDSDMVDNFICDSDWGLEAFPKGLVVNAEKLLKLGQARCDILYNDKSEIQKRIRQNYNLPADSKLVMYAPTFRENSKDGKRGVFVEECSIDFSRLLQSLNEKFGGEWRLCLRLHPQLAVVMKEYPIENIDKNLIVDMSQADDFSEILAASDILVTDYSSVAMDAGFSGMPVFLYADDIEQYAKGRGGMFFTYPQSGAAPIIYDKAMTPNIDAVLPFPLARNNDELAANIAGFDQEKYKSDIATTIKAIGFVATKTASANAADVIEEKLRRKVL